MTVWQARAELSELAVIDRHVRSIGGVLGGQLAMSAWPATVSEARGHPWRADWQALFILLRVGAYSRDPQPARAEEIKQHIAGVRYRGRVPITRWADPLAAAWTLLAIQGVVRAAGLPSPLISGHIAEKLVDKWYAAPSVPRGLHGWRQRKARKGFLGGGGWHGQPQNALPVLMAMISAEIMAGFERRGAAYELRQAVIDSGQLESGCIADVIVHPRAADETETRGTIVSPATQGVVLYGLMEGERMSAEGSPDARLRPPVTGLVTAILDNYTRGGLLVVPPNARHGEATGLLLHGLASFVLAREAGGGPVDNLQRLAARVVMNSAEAAWERRLEVRGLPVFGARWDRDTALPSLTASGREFPERYLGTQLSGWMAMTAAVRVSSALN